MNVPAWLNVALFALSQRLGYCLLIAVAMLLLWWSRADYYVSRNHPENPEPDDTSLVAAVFLPSLALLVLATQFQIKRGLRGFVDPDPNFQGTGKNERRAMLSHIADNCKGISNRYVVWLRDNGSGCRAWFPALWLPGLAMFLAFPPLHSGLMESIAEFSRKTPPSLLGVASEDRADDSIYAIVSEAEQGSGVKTITGLDFQNPHWVRPPASQVATASRTFLVFYAGDYPHVHRHIEVSCTSPYCVPRSDSRPHLRRAIARFEYMQPNALLQRPLNAFAALSTCWGQPLPSGRIPID
jgi:hypothetical protein